MRRIALATTVVATIFGSGALLAAPKQSGATRDHEHCIDSRKAPSQEASVEACTRLINSGRVRSPYIEELYVKRMQTLYVLSRYGQSIADADQLIKLVPHVPQGTFTNVNLREAYYYRGASYFRRTDYAKAIQDLSVVISNFSGQTTAILTRGKSYAALDDPDRAIADFNEVLRIDPKYGSVITSRALANEKKGDLPKALADDGAVRYEFRVCEQGGSD
jgi:tetratricopeptide (TPR) repeat protein